MKQMNGPGRKIKRKKSLAVVKKCYALKQLMLNGSGRKYDGKKFLAIVKKCASWLCSETNCVEYGPGRKLERKKFLAIVKKCAWLCSETNCGEWIGKEIRKEEIPGNG